MPGFNFMGQGVETIARYRNLIIGSWLCNNTSAPTDLTPELAKCGVVARTGVGIYTFTWTLQTPGKVLEALPGLRGAVTNQGVSINSINATTKVITLNTQVAGAVADINAIRVSLWVWCSRMTLQND
jgi:hypothetical protein